jgi:23S rRNA pseudouridine2605 synthase
VARTGIARALSKLGFSSRSRARELISAGRVRLNGKLCREPDHWVDPDHDRIEVDSQVVRETAKVYLMLNKPRGLVTTASDEHGRATVFKCFKDAQLPVLSPVGRLDKASEGLLLFTNDTSWAAGITEPGAQLEKVYHVQVNRITEAELIERMQQGIQMQGDLLSARRVALLRQGTRNCWLEIVLTEGKNRHIRRLLAAFDVEVLRLMRVAIGPLPLGELPKGAFRHLTASEVQMLSREQRKSRP